MLYFSRLLNKLPTVSKMMRWDRGTHSNGKKKMLWTLFFNLLPLNILGKRSRRNLKYFSRDLLKAMFRFHSTAQQAAPLKQWGSLTAGGWVLIASGSHRAFPVGVTGWCRGHGLPIPAGGFFPGAQTCWLWWCSIQELDATQADETCPALECSFKHKLSTKC